MKKSFIFFIICTAGLHGQTQLGNDIDGEGAGDESGSSVSLNADGNTLAIGGWFNGGNGAYSGHARIFYWDGNAWEQKGTDIDGKSAGDQLGYSISLSDDGNTVAIGAINTDPFSPGRGLVRVYNWSGSAWIQKGVDINEEEDYDWTGHSISLSADGNTLAIGAPENSGNGVGSGQVRVFFWDGNAWVQKGIEINGESPGDYSGCSVSLSADGNTLAIGALANGGNGAHSGHVRVFYWDGNAWAQQGADINGEAANDMSGGSISINHNGNILAIGASGNDGNGVNAGHVRIYSWNGNAWTQKGVDIDGEAADDGSGGFVSINSDGNTVAIGAARNSGNGYRAGHVRVYHWDGSAWVQMASDIDGEAAEDFSGGCVSLSNDGNTVAIGAAANDGNGSGSGHVRVYRFNNAGVADNFLNQSDIHIYPNPVSGKINVDFKNQQTGSMMLYNITGKLLLKQTIGNKKLQKMDVSQLANGTYLLRIQTPNGQLSKKIMVLR